MSPGKFQLTRDVLPRSFRRAKIWLTATTSVLPSHSRRRASKDTRKHRLRSGTRRMSTELNTHSVSHADRWPWRTALTLQAARGRVTTAKETNTIICISRRRGNISRARSTWSFLWYQQAFCRFAFNVNAPLFYPLFLCLTHLRRP
jgi:hypothetical protein